MRRSLFALVPVLAAALAAAPQPAPVVFTGTVTDMASNPATAVTIRLEGTTRATVTGADGTYRLVAPAVRGARVTLSASRVGLETGRRTVPVEGDTVHVDFRLAASSLALEGLVVSAAGATTMSRMSSPIRIRGANTPRDANTESYALIQENRFHDARRTPLSTFSADVDRASYANVRRFLTEGTRPPKDAVRIEEMINYFPYAYPVPEGRDPIAVSTEVGAAPWNPRNRLLRIGLRTAPVEMRNAPPANLVFLIDVSGSMREPDKLPLVKQSLRLLVDQLRPRDRVALVVYAGAAGVVLPSTPGSERAAILDAIERLEAGGSTAGGAGLRLAYDVARQGFIRGGNNRVILATDGDFNVGVSSDAEMTRLIEDRRAEGTFLTVLGFGRGNLKDSKMESMADHGNGNYAYIDQLLEARKVLVGEMGGTLLTVAKDVKLQVEFNPARVRSYRLIGYENRLLADEDFNDDRRDAGDMGAGHTVTALYEIVPAGGRGGGEVDPLRYQDAPRATGGGELAFVKVRYKLPDGDTSRLIQHPVREGGAVSGDFTFAAAVAGFGMILRDSEHRGTLTLPAVVRLAEGSLGPDPDGYRAEFVRLVRRFNGMER